MKFDPSPTMKRRRRERFWVALVCALTIFFGFLEGLYFQVQSDLPFLGNIFLFALINLNVILLLLLAYLVLRNIVKLIFERKRKILGHKLRTRLVIAFIGLTLIPTIPLFWVATQFIFSSLDYWFSHNVEQSLEQSVAFAKNYLDQSGRDLTVDARLIEPELSQYLKEHGSKEPDFDSFLGTLLTRYNVDGLFCFDSNLKLVWQAKSSTLPAVKVETLRGLLLKGAEPGDPARALTVGDGDRSAQEGLISTIHMNAPGALGGTEDFSLGVLRLIPQKITRRLSAITSGYEDYLQLKLLQHPLKLSHFITFCIVTLLVIFSAVWFGFFLAKNITVPIQALVSATQQVAEGDLTLQLDSDRDDEIGMLITSFNKMVRDLHESREQLDRTYSALKQSHLELEERRRYMEIVLKHIAAGVVSIDASGRIMTMNKSAEQTFGLHSEQARGRLYSELVQPAQLEIVQSFMSIYKINRPPYLEKKVQVMMDGRPTVLLIKASVLLDEQDQFMGVVVVLDDLTDLEKVQRMAAWREVARRIAHEIKNPLTPIKLSAQRLRRKFSGLMEPSGSVLDECTQTIIQQVDDMQHLVDEFSKFARLPQVQLLPCDLTSIVEESLALYRDNYPGVSFSLRENGSLPLLQVDRHQFKQALINILENSLHALDDKGGSITIALSYDHVLKMARLECADTGHGLSPDDKLRMFEPYYSTKEKGTGLGLAIVASIIADHNGFVRVRDNQPVGTVIVIELPG
jgi:two-component system nitrogen regulation sensor histidine kinase NtrY